MEIKRDHNHDHDIDIALYCEDLIQRWEKIPIQNTGDLYPELQELRNVTIASLSLIRDDYSRQSSIGKKTMRILEKGLDIIIKAGNALETVRDLLE